ncbi:MAG TPA: NUDIX hydrolase [Aestuariivirgaceae bacterium]|nr:NUDIX hydrolase [Aestuariivirgaceae bacterium]
MKSAAIVEAAPETEDGIHFVAEVDISVDPAPWPFARENAAKVSRFWNKAVDDKPSLHDGQVFMLTRWSLDGDRFRGVAQQTNYASFLYWRDLGYPEVGARNCFGSAVVRSKEGHIVYGRNASHTLTAGLVYPPGGSFGPEDTAGDRLDVDRNMARELLEETGLHAATARRVPGYLCVRDGPRIALAAQLVFDVGANELRRSILDFISADPQPELDEIVVFRRRAFLRHHRMPPYARMLVEHLLTV